MSEFSIKIANQTLTQLRSVVQTLEYLKRMKNTAQRAKLYDLAITAVSILEADIYENEMQGIARFKEEKP